MIGRALLVLSLVLGALAPPAVTEAQTVSVGRIRGPRGRRVARQLRRALVDAGFTETDEDPQLEITGRVRRRGRRMQLELELAQGSEVGRVEARERTTQRLVAAVTEEIRMLVPAAAEEPEPPPEEPEPQASATPAEPRAPAVAPGGVNPLDDAEDALEVWVGGGVAGRAQSFRGDLFDSVGSYKLDAAPILSVRGRWFPLRHFSDDPLLGVGVTMSAWTAFGLSSERAGEDMPEGLSTTMYEASFGFIYRLTLAELFTLEPGIDYAVNTFRLTAPGPDRLDGQVEAVPDVVYEQLRPRLAAELNLPAGFAVRLEAAWLAVLGAGRLDDADWFPRSSTTGVELGGSVRWRFDRWFAARLYFTHSRFISALSPEPGDARVAGGALDEWTRGGFELAFIVPGAP